MGKKILVVEDERNIVDILTFNLAREGYGTLEALDGAAGLRLALEQDPDLILLDLMLPKMDGFEVCRRLRVGPPPSLCSPHGRKRRTRCWGWSWGRTTISPSPFPCGS